MVFLRVCIVTNVIFRKNQRANIDKKGLRTTIQIGIGEPERLMKRYQHVRRFAELPETQLEVVIFFFRSCLQFHQLQSHWILAPIFYCVSDISGLLFTYF